LSSKKKKRTSSSSTPQAPRREPDNGTAKEDPARRSRARGVHKPPKGQFRTFAILGVVIIGLVIAGRASHEVAKRIKSSNLDDSLTTTEVKLEEHAEPEWPVLTFEEIQAQRRIINVHEHIQNLELASIHLSVMDELGIRKICLMGSSWFTITLDEKYGFTRYDENNEELLKIAQTYPGRFEAWTCVNPLDSGKFDKFKDLVSRGATGLKLYVGHGYVTKAGEYMFHTCAMDDPGMLPLYAYCEENYIPVCIHVNPYEGKKGFAEELIAVLTQFPNMKVDVPHFMLSSIQSDRLREYLDTFPNVYTDISFGDYYVAAGLKRISKSPTKFKRLFADYPDRIMYATDLVLTEGRRKTREWVHDQFRAYLDMLTQETYTTPAVPGQTLNGLALPDYLLNRVLYKNYEDFVAKRPRDTKITRKIDWARMNVAPTGRKPGQTFPPSTNTKE